MEKGTKTTEFWLTLAGMALVAINGTDFVNIPWEQLMVVVGANGAYAISRGIRKFKT